MEGTSEAGIVVMKDAWLSSGEGDFTAAPQLGQINFSGMECDVPFASLRHW